MRQVLSRARALSRRPALLATLGLLGGGGSALVLLPLFGVPGFELGFALAIGVGLLGGVAAIASAHQEGRLLRGEQPPPPGATRTESAAGASALALGAALLLNVGVLVPPFLAATLYALVGTRCSPFALVGFYPLLTLPSAVLASAAGVLCGFWRPRVAGAALAYGGLLLASALATAWPLVFGPQVFAFNHFLGHLPGPLYDEALEVTPALGWFRLQTLLWAALLWMVAAACLDVRAGRLGRPRPGLGGLVLLGVLVAGVGLIEWKAPTLGLRMTDSYLAEELGGVRETPHFRLHYPRGMERDDVERMARDLEFRHAQLSSFLGEAPAERIRVWLYRGEAQKQALVGAGRTQFAKPWRYELHINARDYPHSSLRHELAHVMAAPAGGGLFGVTTRLGVWPLMGVIEGFAVAADNAVRGELTLHEWAAGMRRQGLAPDVRKLVGPQGFYQSAPARAYTLSGSFLRYLADTYGPQKLRALYAHADFEAAYGRTLDSLATEWEGYLDALPLDEAAISRAFLRFRTGSLFARSCAREVARLEEHAGQALYSDPEEALALYQRAAALQPEEPGYPLGQASALDRLERPEEAARVLSALAAQVQDRAALAAEVAMARADVALRLGQSQQARELLGQALSLAASPEVTRTAQVKLAALDAPERQAPIRAYFQAPREELRVVLLARALQSSPEDPYLHYLLGRRLHAAGAPSLALEHLGRALEHELPDALRREALRLRLESAFLAGDCAAVRQQVATLPDYGQAFAAVAQEWQSRCDFEEQTAGGPLVPRRAFR